MDQSPPTVLVLAVVQIHDVANLMRRLIAEGFGTTRIDAAGAFLRRENAVVLVATTEARLPVLDAIVGEICPRRVETWLPPPNDGTIGLYAPPEPDQVEVGGAVVLAVPIERIEYLRETEPAGVPV